MSAGEHIDNLGAALAKVRQPQVAHHEEAGTSEERNAEYRENDAAGDAIELAIMRSPAQTIGNVLVHATIAALGLEGYYDVREGTIDLPGA